MTRKKNIYESNLTFKNNLNRNETAFKVLLYSYLFFICTVSTQK